MNTTPADLASYLPLALLLGSLAGCASVEKDPKTPSLIEELRRMATEGPITVAHRGASGRYPENTIPAFVAGVHAGAQVVELDFYQSSDGVLVCFHDSGLDRTTDAKRVMGESSS